MSDEEIAAEAIKLWQRYLSLTRELLKFINQEDVDTFIMIVNHRGQLIEKIDALPSKEYRKSAEFKELAEKIMPLDREIMYKARGWLTKSRRQNSVVRSYDIETSLAMTQSLSFNQKY
ncbi:MAG: flagellar protein FliT [Selenomonadaceae bacterium]|nr:flagellar protein FliT [Selenomonadaceae bacterium]